MAGIGPPPKDKRTRQRRNKVAGAAALDPAARAKRTPALPKREDLRVCQEHRELVKFDALGMLTCPGKGTAETPAHEVLAGQLVSRPPLPWHPMTKAWWKDTWRSPMSAEYLQADVHGLFVLAELVDQFWYHPDPDAAKEIRLQRQAFGLTPIDRRRLQWEIEDPERGPQAHQPEPGPATTPGVAAEDPRRNLRAVK